MAISRKPIRSFPTLKSIVEECKCDEQVTVDSVV